MAQRAGVRIASASFHYWGFSAPAKTFTASSYTLSITSQPLRPNYIQTTKHKVVSEFMYRHVGGNVIEFNFKNLNRKSKN